MSAYVTHCHVKLAREDGRSPHMDPALCGNVTGAYDVASGPDDYERIRLALQGPDEFPLCPSCEELMK